MPAPTNEKELVELLVARPKKFKRSHVYEELLDGDYKMYLDNVTEICTAIAAYLEALIDELIHEPENASEVKKEIILVLDAIEEACNSRSDSIINFVTTGIFERVESTEDDLIFNTILRNLRPSSRILWDRWMPLISSREPDPVKGIDIP